MINTKIRGKSVIFGWFSLDLVKCLAGEGEKEPPACK